MPPPSLKNPLLKVERAKEHLDVLDAKLSEFSKTQPFRVTHYEDVQNGRYIMRLQIPIIDPRLAVIAGDAVYNLRSSLDHIAWQLALLTKDRPYGRTEFPIVGEDTPENIRGFKRVTRDIPSNAIDEIKALQPYLRGPAYKDDLLWKLDKLCNIDKHRVIPAQGTALDNIKIPIGIKPTFSTLDDAAIVTMPIAVKAQMAFAPPPTADILFGSEIDGIVINARQLGELYEHVRDSVLPRFARFLPG